MKRRLKWFSSFLIIVLLLVGCTETRKKFSIKFNSNGGSVVRSIVEYPNTPVTKPSDPIKEGYTFDGWYEDKFLTISYSFSVMPENDITIYAKWLINTYTIIFETNGGNPIDSITQEFDTIYTLPVPTKEGHQFLGWYSDIHLVNYYDQNRIPGKDLILYAKWTNGEDVTINDKEQYRMQVDQTVQEAIDIYYGEPGVYNLLPSIGEVNTLVIPIQFPNDKFLVSELNRINDSFFGDGLDYESIQSYYHKSSYGALTLNGTVLTPYTAKYNSSYYDNYYSQENEDSIGVDLLIEEIIMYYSSTNPDLDISLYDSEGDYYIDAVYLVYSSPIDYVANETIYWAFQSFYTPTNGYDDDDYVAWGDYGVGAYVFGGVDFLFENEVENAKVFIHETGHLLGLEDYYDYTEGKDQNIGGLGGADIMDGNAGDHNPYSKLLLDWIDPLVIQESTTITIDKYDTSGDAIIISKDFDNIFEEYFIMNYYTPTGLNVENDYLDESGLIMYQVKSYLPMDYNNLFAYSMYFQNNNSDSPQKLISLVEADGRHDISKNNDVATNDDLLQEGDVFILKNSYRSVCSIQVVEQTEESITLTFNFFE